MTVVDEGVQTTYKHKYSIPRLLELSSQICLPFDLSRFSYDSVRAGIIPALSQCAMSNRDLANNGVRGWSSESSNTLEDIVVFPGVQAIKPCRQPQNPPRESLANTDRGFARFLKKHSSPTHQRVTAGGRIVPMEKRAGPPQFIFKNGDPASDGSYAIDEKTKQAPQVTSRGCESGQPTMAGNLPPVGAFPQPFFANTTAPSFGVLGPHTATSDYTLSTNPPIYAAVMYPPPFSSGFIPDQIAATGVPTWYPNSLTCMPWTAPSTSIADGYVMAPATTAPWISNEQANVAPITGSLSSPLDFSLLLEQATQEFNNIDQQLKELDRYRAMRHYDPTLAQQRLIIVEKRSNVKDNMDRLRMIVEGKQTQSEILHGSSPTHGWNVNAPSYIPKSADKNALTKKKEEKVFGCGNSAIPAPAGHYVQGSNAGPFTYPIPLCDPGAYGDPDEWLFRRGPMPPETAQPHQDRNSVLLGATNKVKDDRKAKADEMDGDMAQSYTLNARRSLSRQPYGHDHRESLTSIRSVGPLGLLGSNSTEKMDRLGKSFDNKVVSMDETLHGRVHDRSATATQGIEVQRPSSTDTNPWEPTELDPVADPDRPDLNASNLHNQENSSKESDSAGGMTKRHDGLIIDPDACNYAKEDGMWRWFPPGLVVISQSGSPVGSASESLPEAPQGSLGDGLVEGYQAIQQSSGVGSGPGGSMLNKGFSSVAVQNVNATSQLPLNFDGALDAAQRKLQQSVSAGHLNPHVVRRATTAGSAWFGPHRRDYRAPIDKENPLETNPFKRSYL